MLGNQCHSGRFLKGLTNGYSGNTYELQGFGIPFCLFLSLLSLTLWTRFTFIHQPVTLDISQKVPVPWIVWEENSTPSLPATFLTQKIQNAFGKCLWKVLTALLNPWVLLLKTIHYVEEAARNSLGTLELSLPQQLALLPGTAADCHRSAGWVQVTATSSLWARGTQHPTEKTPGFYWETLINQKPALSRENISSEKLPRKQKNLRWKYSSFLSDKW